MSAPLLSMKDLLQRCPTPLIRGLTVLGCFAVFLTAASLFQPDDSKAIPADANGVAPLRGTTTGQNLQRYVPSTEPAFMGALVGVNYTVDIYLAPQGARYTVKDAAGRVLAELISADDLYRDFPDLDVDQMHAEAPVEQPVD